MNRLLTQKVLPPEAWQERLTTFFGTTEWKDRFYQISITPNLFDDEEVVRKTATVESLSNYFVERLQLIFGMDGVSQNPLTLTNSKKSLMYLLCFASANKTGVKIADWLLTHKPMRQNNRNN